MKCISKCKNHSETEVKSVTCILGNIKMPFGNAVQVIRVQIWIFIVKVTLIKLNIKLNTFIATLNVWGKLTWFCLFSKIINGAVKQEEKKVGHFLYFFLFSLFFFHIQHAVMKCINWDLLPGMGYLFP